MPSNNRATPTTPPHMINGNTHFLFSSHSNLLASHSPANTLIRSIVVPLMDHLFCVQSNKLSSSQTITSCDLFSVQNPVPRVPSKRIVSKDIIHRSPSEKTKYTRSSPYI